MNRQALLIKKIILSLILLFMFTFPALAQDFTFEKAKADYVFTEDKYRQNLENFNSKRDSYQKNPTLSLKEEARSALFSFLAVRNDLVKSYLNMVRTKTFESAGLTIIEKQNIFDKIDTEVEWYGKRKDVYKQTDPLEDLVNKSKEEDSRYKTDTLPKIYYSLSFINLNSVIVLKNKHQVIYETLKKDSNNLVSLGRADSSLFDRWFKDIDGELTKINDIEKATRVEIEKIFSGESFERNQSYKKGLEVLDPVKLNLLKLNQFIKELETTIDTKR